MFQMNGRECIEIVSYINHSLFSVQIVEWIEASNKTDGSQALQMDVFCV